MRKRLNVFYKRLGFMLLCVFFPGFAFAAEKISLSTFLGTIFIYLFIGIITLSGWSLAYLLAKKYFALKRRPLELPEEYLQMQNIVKNFNDVFVLSSSCILLWENPRERPLIYGELPGVPKDISEQKALHNFALWLVPSSKAQLEQKLKALCYEGYAFDLIVETVEGEYLSVCGRITSGCAMTKIQEITQAEKDHVRQKQQLTLLTLQLQLFYQLLDRVNAYAWVRDENGQIHWANKSYREAISYEKHDNEIGELFPKDIVKTLDHLERTETFYAPAILSGDRRHFCFNHIRKYHRSATLAFDVSEIEKLKQELELVSRGYAESFDLLPTAVAIFDSNLKLRFANQAFAVLWRLENSFLETHPSHVLVLDKLREKGLLPEQADWRAWKENLFSAYRSPETVQHIWDLPDGRTLRVFAHPHPQGGVIWLYENLTEKLDLETRYNALIKIQGETLDHLSDGVVLFGADGRLRLSNTSFINHWSLPNRLAVEGTHVQSIEEYCDFLVKDNEWSKLTAYVTSYQDERSLIEGRMELNKGLVFDYRAAPLPQGQTLITFVDVTANVHYSRALREKNEALEAIEKLRSAFIQHVSYELRTPLTNIIGFSQLLTTQKIGLLNRQQKEYLEHITNSSTELLNIVNDILDLATVDAGIMELNIERLDIGQIIDSALVRVKDQLEQKRISVERQFEPDLPNLFADAGRVRQIFIKILLNAIQFSPMHSKITLSAYSNETSIVFCIKDEGYGIAPEVLEDIFKPFSSHAQIGNKAGTGLGLSLVKGFVELHGGEVKIESSKEKGTTVYCAFLRDKNKEMLIRQEDQQIRERKTTTPYQALQPHFPMYKRRIKDDKQDE